jgi:hypothetical protein
MKRQRRSSAQPRVGARAYPGSVTVLLLHRLIAGKMKPAVRTRVDVVD